MQRYQREIDKSDISPYHTDHPEWANARPTPVVDGIKRSNCIV
ncbi:MAG: hypothetical protein QOG89_2576, partial [Thermomicrobiales bacterium]|nr:hypothetical protein [Thermomicrobiales bacterium]